MLDGVVVSMRSTTLAFAPQGLFPLSFFFLRLWLSLMFTEVKSLYEEKDLSSAKKEHRFKGVPLDLAMWARTILTSIVGNIAEARLFLIFSSSSFLPLIVQLEAGGTPLDHASFHRIVREGFRYPGPLSMLATELYKIATAQLEDRGDYKSITTVRAIFSLSEFTFYDCD